MTSYREWLEGLDEAQLTRLLDNRPKVALDPPPRTYAALAHLLQMKTSVDAALRSLDRGAQFVLGALETHRTRGDLAARFGEGSVNSAADIDRALGALVGHGMAWPSGDGYRVCPLYDRRFECVGTPQLNPPTIGERIASGQTAQRLAFTRFSETVESVVDAVDSGSIAAMATGGIGIREVRALAKKAGVEYVADLELALSLAGRNGLIDASAKTVRCTTDFPVWRVESRSTRMASLIAHWWCSEESPTNRRPSKGKPAPVLGAVSHSPSTAVLRHRMMASLPNTRFVDVDSAVAYIQWAMPDVEASAPTGDTAAVWREATVIGLLADGAPTELSRALGRLGPAEVPQIIAEIEPIVGRILAGADGTLRLLPDLTAVVSGPVPENVSTLLTSSGHSESKGAASTWRFTPNSVRHYLDEGGSAAELIDALTAASATEVPQSLDYLIRDCERRHGHIAIFSMSSCIVSEDESLILEIAAGTLVDARQVAPTVLVSSLDGPGVLAILRSAGYAPVDADGRGNVQISRAKPAHMQSKSPYAVRTGTAPSVLAAALVSGTPAVVDVDRVANSMRAWSRLPARDIDVLARAVAFGTAVSVDVMSPKTGLTKDQISDVVLDSGFIHAWSERAGAGRSIELSGIRMATEVPS